jgi:hypothetical protein
MASGLTDRGCSMAFGLTDQQNRHEDGEGTGE